MWLHIFAIIFILLLFAYKSTKKPNRFPPGPPRLPVIGSLPYITVKIKSSNTPSLMHGMLQGKYDFVRTTQTTIHGEEINFISTI
jgi:hypothetical protein